MAEWFVPDVSTINRASGRSSVAAAAYRAGERLEDERTGEVHDYRRKQGVEAAFLVLPEGAPAWDRERLWNEVERAEKRQASRLARELMLPLPAEVSAEARKRIVEDAARYLVERYGVGVDCDIHAPPRLGDERNHHAHLLFTTRRLTPEGLGEKTRVLDSARTSGPEVEAIRAHVGTAINRELSRAGLPTRVDHRSYERRGIEREAGQHLGPAASAMERKGQRTRAGDANRAVAARNAERAALRAQARAIEAALKIEERKAQAEAQARAKEEAERRSREREQRRFERWANRKRAELQSRQIDEAGELGERHARSRIIEGDRLAQTYEPGRQAARAALEEIERRQERGGLFYRISGAARRDREQAHAHRANLASADQREAEARGALKAKQEAERARLEQRHEEQRHALERRIEEARERRELEGWKPLPRPANDREPDKPRNLTEQIERDRARERERENDPDRGRDREREL